MNIYYLGPEGSYCHTLAKKVFTESLYSLLPKRDFSEVVSCIRSEADCIGILPLENSTTSNVHENIDHLFYSDMAIVGEASLIIDLHLFGLPGSELSKVTHVISQPKALSQCSSFLADNRITPEYSSSTSDGKRRILERGDPSFATLGGNALAEDGEVVCLKENIGNEKYNMTRFVFVSQEMNQDAGCDKMSVTFKVPHKSGSLAFVLTRLAEVNANLTHILSRPLPGSDFEYNFWIDLESTPENMKTVQEVLGRETLEYRILGRYKKGKIYES